MYNKIECIKDHKIIVLTMVLIALLIAPITLRGDVLGSLSIWQQLVIKIPAILIGMVVSFFAIPGKTDIKIMNGIYNCSMGFAFSVLLISLPLLFLLPYYENYPDIEDLLLNIPVSLISVGIGMGLIVGLYGIVKVELKNLWAVAINLIVFLIFCCMFVRF